MKVNKKLKGKIKDGTFHVELDCAKDIPEVKSVTPQMAYLSNGMVLKNENGRWVDTQDGKEVELSFKLSPKQ